MCKGTIKFLKKMLRKKLKINHLFNLSFQIMDNKFVVVDF